MFSPGICGAVYSLSRWFVHENCHGRYQPDQLVPPETVHALLGQFLNARHPRRKPLGRFDVPRRHIELGDRPEDCRQVAGAAVAEPRLRGQEEAREPCLFRRMPQAGQRGDQHDHFVGIEGLESDSVEGLQELRQYDLCTTSCEQRDLLTK